MTNVAVPSYDELMWPTLQALIQLGGSGSIQEIFDTVVELGDYTEPQLAEPLNDDGNRTKFDHRRGWARHHLKKIGAVENSARGVWAITEQGRGMPNEAVVQAQAKQMRSEYYAQRRAMQKQQKEEEEETEDAKDWKDELLTVLKERLAPDAFERLSQRLLRECGFQSVKVTGKSGDGGIDGVRMYRMSLLTFPTLFQCKRYKGSVPSKDIRDFRGAMQGRAEKGLFITTGTFTRDAMAEARRDGAIPIELIDGGRLCDLLKEYDLGVTTKQRIEEDVIVDPEFFEDL